MTLLEIVDRQTEVIKTQADTIKILIYKLREKECINEGKEKNNGLD